MIFEGEIGEIDLVQRLVELGRERFTGAIRFEQEGIIKIVYFKGGDVLSASTNDRTDAIDEILLRADKVNKEHVKQSLAKRKESETLGDALLNLGFITRKELTWARRVQVIGILRSVRAWTTGSYAIVADYLPKREEGTLFPLQQILIELFVTEQERQPFERALDGGSAVLTKTDGFDEAFQRLGLNEDAAEIASKIDGTRTAAEIAGASGKDVFNTYKLLEALRALGLLRKAQAKDELSFESVGVADAADAWSSGKMPAFETEPEPPVEPMLESAPIPAAAVIPAPNPQEVQWGLDDAQTEEANKLTEPEPPPPAAVATRRATLSGTQTRRAAPQFTRPQSKTRSHAAALALIVILILAAAGFGGWYWWKGQATARQPAPVVQATKRPVIKPTPVAPAPPVTATTEVNAGAAAAVIPPPATTSGAPPTATASTGEVAAAPPRKASSPPTFASSSVKPADATRSRLNAMAADFARNPKGNFAVQFELVCQTSSLAKAVEAGGANVWFLPISYRGQPCYRVFWGHYDTREAADAGAAQIPAAMRSSKPVVVAVPKP